MSISESATTPDTGGKIPKETAISQHIASDSSLGVPRMTDLDAHVPTFNKISSMDPFDPNQAGTPKDSRGGFITFSPNNGPTAGDDPRTPRSTAATVTSNVLLNAAAINDGSGDEMEEKSHRPSRQNSLTLQFLKPARHCLSPDPSSVEDNASDNDPSLAKNDKLAEYAKTQLQSHKMAGTEMFTTESLNIHNDNNAGSGSDDNSVATSLAANPSPMARGRSSTISGHELKDATDVIAQFVTSKLPPDVLRKSQFDSYGQFNVQTLLRKAHRLCDRATSHLGDASQREQSISELNECLETIYLIYYLKTSHSKGTGNLRDKERSAAITLHMNTALNLASLYTMNAVTLGNALELYEDAMALYDADPRGFRKSQVNLKAWVLRGMANVYIKQEDYTSALRFLQRALPLAVQSQDTITEYHILCTQARCLLDAQQWNESSDCFEKSVTKHRILRANNRIPVSSIDVDLHSNAGLCYALRAFEEVRVFVKDNVRCVENTPKSMELYGNAAAMYEKAVDLCREIYGEHSIEYCSNLYHFGEVKAQMGDVNKAYSTLKQVKALFIQLESDVKQEPKQIQFEKELDQMILSISSMVDTEIV